MVEGVLARGDEVAGLGACSSKDSEADGGREDSEKRMADVATVLKSEKESYSSAALAKTRRL